MEGGRGAAPGRSKMVVDSKGGGGGGNGYREETVYMHEEGEELPHKSKGESPISETGGFS